MALALLSALVLTACGAPAPAPRVPAVPPSPPAPIPPEIDPFPGSVAELEAIASDPNAGDRGLLALEKLAAILHGVSREPAAAEALRRLYLRASEGQRSQAVGPHLVSALDAAAAVEEADALRRHLACPSIFPYAPGPDGAPAPPYTLSQDHDRQYWERWESLHPIALDLAPKKKSPNAGDDTDTHYLALYAACPEGTAGSGAAEGRAAAWLAVARAHRSRDAHGGPFGIPRAVEAFERAIRAAQSAPRGPTMLHARLELGEALHAEERHRAAALELSRALTLCDETAACAPTEREDALALLADAIAHADFEGPPADAPVIVRADIIDTELRPDVAELKLRVAIDRAVDPALIPKDCAFAPDLLAALAQVYLDMYMFNDALLTFAELRRRFPTHRELPRVLSAVARVNGMAAHVLRPAQAVPRWTAAVTAWDDLTAFVSVGSPWRIANASDADALAAATKEANQAPHEQANVLASLASVLDATARAKEPLPADDVTALRSFQRAIDVWTPLASAGSGGAQARATLAAIRTSELVWLTRSSATIDPARWADARTVGALARDDAEPGTARANVARTLVELADTQIRYEEARFASSRGTQGLAPRARALQLPLRLHPFEELPAPVAEAVKARDGLAAASPDAIWAAVDALNAAAGSLYAYGHTKEASSRLAAALALVCGKPTGMEVFVLAAQVARAGKDSTELTRLAALHADPSTTCAKSPAELAKGRALTKP